MSVLTYFLVLLAPTILLTYILHHRLLHPLSKIPGPFLASISRLWLLYHTLTGRTHVSHLDAHRVHGPIVRVGPNHVLLSDPSHGAWYYSLDKSDWWYCFRPDDHALAFSTELGLKAHNAKKKRVAGAYSLSSLVANEGAMDEQIKARLSLLCSPVSWTRRDLMR